MCVALIGGMDRLERHYVVEAERAGIDLMVYTKYRADIAAKVKNADVMVIFTNKISHKARREVMDVAKTRSITVFFFHSCGVCTLRNFFGCLKNQCLSSPIKGGSIC